jgi:hypothetical protein
VSLSEIGNPPIEGSSVPGDREAAIRYAHRLEQRFHADQQRIFAADRKLKIALDALREEQPNMKVLEAIGLIEAAREVLI